MRKELAEYPVQLRALKAGMINYKKICNPTVMKIIQPKKKRKGANKKKYFLKGIKKENNRIRNDLVNNSSVTVGSVTIRLAITQHNKPKPANIHYDCSDLQTTTSSRIRFYGGCPGL